VNGQLIFVGVDLGNIEDLTIRALTAIKQTQVFIVEDEIEFKHKLKRLNIINDKTIYQWPLSAVHKEIGWPVISDNELIKIIKDQVENNKNVVYCSGEGMPGTTDPGTKLVLLAMENGIGHTVYPGPSISSLVLAHSAFSSSEFIYKAMIPENTKDQDDFLLDLRNKQMPFMCPYIRTTGHGSKTFVLEFLDKIINIFPNDTLITVVINATEYNEFIINDFVTRAKERLLDYTFGIPLKISFLVIPSGSTPHPFMLY